MIWGNKATKNSIIAKPLNSIAFSLSLVLAFAFSAFSQGINDDLIRKDFSTKSPISSPPAKKKVTVPKPAKQPKSVKQFRDDKKTRKTISAEPSRIDPIPTKNVSKNTQVSNQKNNNQKNGSNAEIKPVKVENSPEQKKILPSEGTETVAEIIGRFMDFEKSSTVTYKDWESVVAQTTKTLQDDPNNIQAKAQNILAQGELAFARNDFSNALIHFNAAAQIMPNSSLPHYGIGRIYLVIKQNEQAEESFNNAIKREKNFALAYKGLGDALTAQQKTKKAQEYYKKAAEVGLVKPLIGNQPGKTIGKAEVVPPPVSPYLKDLNEARRLTASKKWKESLDKLNVLLAENKTAEVYIAVGDNYEGLQQMLSAQQAYRKATETEPNSAAAFYKLGSILFELNEFQAASESLEKSLTLDEKGTTINRQAVRKMADKAKEKLK